MDGPRSASRHEIERVISFLDQQLRPKFDWSISSEYPTVFQGSNAHNIKIISEQSKIISHAAVKTLIIKTPLLIYKVAAIGSVVTDNEHRQKGYSRQVIQTCIEEATKQNCDIAILWSDLFDFYKKLDFERAGSEVCFFIDKPLASLSKEKLHFFTTPKVDANAIHRLYLKHSVGSIRNPMDIQKFLCIPNSQIYTAWNNNNQLMAYAVEGKGADLTGYIHEWGGNLPPLIHLLNYIIQSQNKNINLICPQHSINLINTLHSQDINFNNGYLGLIKILNHQSFFQKILRASKILKINDLVLSKENEGFHIGLPNDIFYTKDPAIVTQLLFGPKYPHEIYSFKENTRKELEKIFPLPLWIWGWDSI